MSSTAFVAAAPRTGPFTAIRGIAIVYGLTIISCFAVNIIVRHWPIGPWSGAAIGQNFWLDNVTWQVLSLWWAIIFAVSDLWPFSYIKQKTTRAFWTIAASWIVGWISAKMIYWAGLDASWVFPIVGTIFFLLAFFSFTGENWIVAGLPPARKFLTLVSLIAGITFVITVSGMRWVPAWWFPFLEVGSATGLLGYATRGMKQPGKSVHQMAILFLVVLVCVWISSALGLWDGQATGVSTFWHMGYMRPDNRWLLFFMVGCAINYGLPIMTKNWPFRYLGMPWGGVLACLFYVGLSIAITAAFLAAIGPVFPDINTALTYAYMGVNWSIALPLVFGIGTSEPYLWHGQLTPGTWDDVP